MDSYLNALFMDEDTFNLFLPLETPSLSNFKIIYNFDYQKLDVSALTSVSERINKDAEYYESQGFTFNMGVNDILQNTVRERKAFLNTLGLTNSSYGYACFLSVYGIKA